MKKLIFICTIATLAVAGLSLASCNSSQENKDQHEHMDSEHTHSIYACPMECEGDVTYEEAGSCPVCGMDLVVIEN